MKTLIYITTLFLLIITAASGQTPGQHGSTGQDTEQSPSCPTIKVKTYSETIYDDPSENPYNPVTPCPDNEDMDGDGIINGEDDDIDGDGIPNEVENTFENDIDGDGIPNKCDTDSDGDGVPDSTDKCYEVRGTDEVGCRKSIEDRKVFWIHGYQGNDLAWEKPGNYAEETYRIKSYYPDYSSTQESLASCSENLRNDIVNDVDGELGYKDHFVIAHSMGGLVVRDMGELYNLDGKRLFNGIITIGTPHLGAHAASTLTNEPKKLEMAAYEICTKLGAGPAAENVNGREIIGPFATIFGISKILTDEICTSASEMGVPLATSLFETGIEKEINVENAPAIPPMATENRAAFYGTEDDDNETLAVRFMGSMIAPPGDYPLFEAGASDQVGLDTFAKHNLYYYNKYNYYKSNEIRLWYFSSPAITLGLYLYHRNLKNAWKKGVDWFPTYNPTWKSIIKASEFKVGQIGCECEYYDYDVLSGTQIFPGAEDCSEFEDNSSPIHSVICYPLIGLLEITKPSDGFILKESAIGGAEVNYPIREMPGSNHFQMRNDDNTKDAIYKIFFEGLGRAFFKTDKR